MPIELKPGDFTSLAGDYALYRPDYSFSVLNALLALIEKPANEIDFVDVGAGTGIWTRMVLSLGVKSTTAVEPNSRMRDFGIKDTNKFNITWLEGNAEKTGLPDGSSDWVTMASSFHWANFDLATKEFHRILKSGGRFSALWNPRMIEVNPMLVEIEEHIKKLNHDVRRVSSGRSGVTDTLTDKLIKSPYFQDVIYVEGRHTIAMTCERYLGAWRSVNDLRVQLGPKNFDLFLQFVEQRISGLKVIEATYLTRAWSAQRKD